MNQAKKISLISSAYTYTSIGVPVPQESKKDVFAFVFSVGQTEFFNAGQHGFKPDAVYAVRTVEYGGQKELEVDKNGTTERFAIYRTYERTDGRTELYASRRKGVNDNTVNT